MAAYIRLSLFILILATTASCQFFDFFSALQPLVQFTTVRPHIEHTTKRTHRYDAPRTEKQRDSAIIFEETTRANRRTTRKNERKNHSRQQEKVKDTITYPDGRLNTVYNYDTTKSYTTKSPFYEQTQRPNYYVTQNPYKPGVKPPVTHGTPITNRPLARPNEDDTSVTPELIIGPNEDYMSTVEKRRYVELAERMCDKYKSLNIKQVEAIPLLPSPDSVKVNVSLCAPTEVPLVVGGKIVHIREFPHMALLGWKRLQGSGYSWKCGGSLISNQFVLTAGHCAYQDRDNNIIMGPPRVVQIGSSYLDDPSAKLIKVAAVYRHPKYKQPKSYFDIAVVKLATDVTFSDSIKPACLGVPPRPGAPIIATGWGRTEFGGAQSHELRSVSIPVWGISECYDVLGTSRKIPQGPSSDSQICAGEREGGKDTCQGDSGGPAQVQDGCVWRVTAVTSLGRSCGAPQTPALYAIVPRAFVASIAFDSKEIQHKEPTTNRPSNQRNPSINNNNNNDRIVYESSSINNQRRNDRNNYDNSSTYNQNSNDKNDYETSSIHNQRRNDRNSYDSSSSYNQNSNQRNNGRNDYDSSSTYNQNGNQRNERNNYDSSSAYNQNNNQGNNERTNYDSSSIYYQTSNQGKNERNNYDNSAVYNQNSNQRNGRNNYDSSSNYNQNQRNNNRDYESSLTYNQYNSNQQNNQRNDYEQSNTRNSNQKNYYDYTTQRNYQDNNYPARNDNYGAVQTGQYYSDSRVWW